MFERDLRVEDIKRILNTGLIIKSYEEDKPYPSYMLLGFINKKPVHVLVANNREENICIIITVYRPEKKIWSKDFKTKRI
jgi:hypothetical protein